MGWPMKGRTVTVVRPVRTGTDPLGSPVFGKPEREEIGNVLVASPTSEDVEESTRRYGVECKFTLHFPKAWAGGLRGCSVELPAPWEGSYGVLGDPAPLDDALVPGDWHMPVYVSEVRG